MRCVLASRLLKAIGNNNKSNVTQALIGCSIGELKLYLESKFTKGMSWDNYGKNNTLDSEKYWEIDHIIPCARFDLSEPEEQVRCFNYRNMQPLWWWDNRSKGDTSPEKFNRITVDPDNIYIKHVNGRLKAERIKEKEDEKIRKLEEKKIKELEIKRKRLEIIKNMKVKSCLGKLCNGETLLIAEFTKRNQNDPNSNYHSYCKRCRLEESRKRRNNIAIKDDDGNDIIENIKKVNKKTGKTLTKYYQTDEGKLNKTLAHEKRSETMEERRKQITEKKCPGPICQGKIQPASKFARRKAGDPSSALQSYCNDTCILGNSYVVSYFANIVP